MVFFSSLTCPPILSTQYHKDLSGSSCHDSLFPRDSGYRRVTDIKCSFHPVQGHSFPPVSHHQGSQIAQEALTAEKLRATPLTSSSSGEFASSFWTADLPLSFNSFSRTLVSYSGRECSYTRESVNRVSKQEGG